jgi:hypothetical protein
MDSVKVGGNALSLYSKYNFNFISPNYSVALTLISNALKFTNSKNNIYTIRIHFGFNCIINTKIQYDSVADKLVNVPDYLFIYSRNPMTDAEDRTINVPYGLNMGLSSTEFSGYDDDETKNITFPKGLSVVTEGYYLRAWKPGIVVGADLKDQIQINYGFRTLAANSVILFHKPGDIIDSGNNTPNQIQIPWGLKFKTDETYLTIFKPGYSTKGVKLELQTL